MNNQPKKISKPIQEDKHMLVNHRNSDIVANSDECSDDKHSKDFLDVNKQNIKSSFTSE